MQTMSGFLFGSSAKEETVEEVVDLTFGEEFAKSTHEDKKPGYFQFTKVIGDLGECKCMLKSLPGRVTYDVFIGDEFVINIRTYTPSDFGAFNDLAGLIRDLAGFDASGLVNTVASNRTLWNNVYKQSSTLTEKELVTVTRTARIYRELKELKAHCLTFIKSRVKQAPNAFNFTGFECHTPIKTLLESDEYGPFDLSSLVQMNALAPKWRRKPSVLEVCIGKNQNYSSHIELPDLNSKEFEDTFEEKLKEFRAEVDADVKRWLTQFWVAPELR